MADLATQIREMLKILDVMDPQSAEEIRGGSKFKPSIVVPNITAPPTTLSEDMHVAYRISPTMDKALKIDADATIQGVIFSEILGKPLSRRRNSGRLN